MTVLSTPDAYGSQRGARLLPAWTPICNQGTPEFRPAQVDCLTNMDNESQRLGKRQITDMVQKHLLGIYAPGGLTCQHRLTAIKAACMHAAK